MTPQRLLCAAFVLVFAVGCERKINGPAPTVTGVTPKVVCQEQLTTSVTVQGDGLAPLASDSLTATPLLNLPEVSLVLGTDLEGQPASADPIFVPDDPTNAGASDVAWKSQQQLDFNVCPAGTCSKRSPAGTDYTVAPGLYAVHLRNKNGRDFDFPGSLLAVPPPVLTSVTPDVACSDKANDVVLAGQYFIRGADIKPSVRIGTQIFAPSAMSGCKALPGTAGLESCTSMTVSIPSKGLAPGAPLGIEVTNGSTFACHSVATNVTLTLIPEPTLATVVPDLACTEEGTTSVTVTGTGFAQVDAVTPTLVIGALRLTTTAVPASCTAVPGPRERVLRCTSLTATIARNALAPTGASTAFATSVENPTPVDCKTMQQVKFTTVPRPHVTAVVPDLVCTAGGGTFVAITGTGFITVNGTAPTVTIGALSLGSTVVTSDCTAVSGPTETVQTCTRLSVAIPGATMTGAFALTVINPTPAGCRSTDSITFTVLPPPTLTSVSPDISSPASGAVSATLTGTGFVKVGTTLPTVSLGGTALPAAAVTAATGCAPIAGTTTGAELCTGLAVTIPTTAPTGRVEVTVTNPQPVGCVTLPKEMYLAPAPTVSSTNPSGMCLPATAALPVTVRGTGLLGIGSGTPTVTIGARTYTTTLGPCGAASTCTPVAGFSQSISLCTDVCVSVATTDFVVGGSQSVSAANPAPAAATSSQNGTFLVAPPPTITSVTPNPTVLCQGGGDVTITGTGFLPGMTVTLIKTSSGVRVSTASVVVNSTTTAVANFGALPAPASFDRLEVSNPGNCSASSTIDYQVTRGIIAVFADPAVVWNGMNTPVSFYAANVSPVMDGGIGRVQIVAAASGNTPTDLCGGTSPTRCPTVGGKTDRTIARVAQGTDAGSYDVILTDAAPACPARMVGRLSVTSNTSLTLTGILPSFGWTQTETDVTITASTAAPSTGFGSLPKVYLVGAGGAVLVQLQAVSVNSSTNVSAVVPAGVPAGVYDLVVVNADGTVGVRPAAFTETAVGAPPPTVTSITPGQIPNNTASQAIVITGNNFRGGLPTNRPGVALRCIDPAGVAITAPAVTVTGSTGTTINATVNTTGAGFANGANCVVVVTNTDDGSQAQYSSLVVVTPQANLTNFIAGPLMQSPRRGLGSVSGNVTQAARFVYGLAGDNGTAALGSVEWLPVDIFGRPGQGGFVTQRYALNTPRTQVASVRIGRYIYVVGGTGTLGAPSAALDSVERAAILDTVTRPANLSIDLNLSLTAGVTAGLYYYRVAALMPATDKFNPGGETLPSEAFGLAIPAVTGDGFVGLDVGLKWDQVPTAIGYRIYRTAVNAAAGTDGLIADTVAGLPSTVTCAAPLCVNSRCSCTDSGATPGAGAPLRLGSTGTWTILTPRLATARQSPAVAWAVDPDPIANPNKAYLYVMGGLSGANAVLASGELLSITIGSDGSHSVPASFTALTSTLTAPRWRLGGYTVTPADTALVGPNSWIWAGGGSAVSPSVMVANFDGARVTAGGQLTAFGNTGPMNPQAAGYGAFVGGDYIYALGGQNGQPDVNNMQAAITAAPPTLANFQGFNPGLLRSRVDLGSAVQSGYFYVLGGAVCSSGPANATCPAGPFSVTNTTEFVLY